MATSVWASAGSRKLALLRWQTSKTILKQVSKCHASALSSSFTNRHTTTSSADPGKATAGRESATSQSSDHADSSKSSHQSTIDEHSLWSSSKLARSAVTSPEEEQDSGLSEAQSPRSTQQFPDEFCVVNFYHLVDIEQPFGVIKQHKERLEGIDILGRIYITKQGINAQFSGPVHAAHAYAEWVGQQAEFQGLRWASDPVSSHQFPRLRLKYRENLVQLSGGTTRLDLSNSEARAQALEPSAWQQMLEKANTGTGPGGDAQPKPIVLDVRNSYEWDGGHFQGAQRPAEIQFNQTPTDHIPEPLRDVPKDTPVMMYCTGGIRCDIYSPVLKEKGFSNLYTLHGGIANYLREIGPDRWKGSMFTFDNRLAVAPDGKSLSEKQLEAASPCTCCGSTAALPHLNCANIDCNRLFLACTACQGDLKGCCSSECHEAAPRMLRRRSEQKVFGRWHTLVSDSEIDEATDAIRSGRQNSRASKRQRRVERLRAKYEILRQQRSERKALVAAAMRDLADSEEKEEDEKSAAMYA